MSRNLLAASSLALGAMLLPLASQADCPGAGVVACSRVELKVSSCKPFAVDDDPWMKKAVANIAKKDPAGAEALRTAYRGVLVQGASQGETLGGCDGSHATLHPTTENGAPVEYFSTVGSCDEYPADEKVVVEVPNACCTGGNDVPCLFLQKARETTKPVLPMKKGAPHAAHGGHATHK